MSRILEPEESRSSFRHVDGPERARTLVLALGNPERRDDGIGGEVLHRLESMVSGLDVKLVNGGTAGLEIVLILEGYRRAIVVDAVDFGVRPGEFRCWQLGSDGLGEGRWGSSIHAASLREALALGAAMALLPPEILLVGIQPQSTDQAPGLTPSVEAAIPGAASMVRKILEETDWKRLALPGWDTPFA